MDSRAPRDGKTIEELGIYHPIETEEKQIAFDADKVRKWVDNGAVISDTVRKILNKKNFTLKAVSKPQI
jgi:small subunit ribosomal protein S16